MRCDLCVILQLLIAVCSAFGVGCVAQTDRVVEITTQTTPLEVFGAMSTIELDFADMESNIIPIRVRDGQAAGIVGGSRRLEGPALFLPNQGASDNSINPIFGVSEGVSLQFFIGIFDNAWIRDGLECSAEPQSVEGPVACGVMQILPLVHWEAAGETSLVNTDFLDTYHFSAVRDDTTGQTDVTLTVTFDTTGLLDLLDERRITQQKPEFPAAFVDILSVEETNDLVVTFTVEEI